jgi:hypothetical protein
VTLFRIALNPDDASTLPYVLSVPVGATPLVLKAKDTWPRTGKVYCHRAVWPDDADLVEETPVRSCVRRGVAIDLVLDRRRENRSQFVVTSLKGGREGIFWQTASTTRKTRPGMRLPTRRSAAGVLEIVIDTRERYAWKFERQQVVLSNRARAVGDDAVEVDGAIVGVVERKKLAELASNVVDGSLLLRLSELAAARRAAIVVEDRWADVFRLVHVAPSMVAEMLAAAQVRYPNVPIVFCENRALAQEWTYRFLGAAAAFADDQSVDLEHGFSRPSETNVYRKVLTE